MRDTALSVLDALAAERAIALQVDAPLAPLTTLRVGGSADRLAAPHSSDELLACLRLAHEAGVAWMVLGNGSDIVVADAGFRGLVIRNRARGVWIDETVLIAESGVPLALLVKRATGLGLTGLEFAISIPGSLGGAVWANAGAHGAEMAGVLEWVEAWDSGSDAIDTLSPADCGLAYRESRFKHSAEVVLRAALHLERGEPVQIAARVAAIHAQRLATQPLAEQNAGSVFRNPPGDHAGRLIDEAGLKGMRVGSASVSRVHANFIVADRGGRAADVRSLAEQVRDAVEDRFGVRLAYEIEFVGEWDPPAGSAE